MLAACGGTGVAIEMSWVQVGDSDLILSLSTVGLTVWLLDKTEQKPYWKYKVCQLQSETFSFCVDGHDAVIAFKDGSIQNFDLRAFHLKEKV